MNGDECVECYTCFRGMSMEKLNPTLVRGSSPFLKAFRLRFDPEPDVCPTSAITPDELSWPRVVRRAFSDPIVTHESTGVHGRGTEEVKTNDVTNRVGIGEVGYVVEFGRPTVGVRFRDIEKDDAGSGRYRNRIRAEESCHAHDDRQGKTGKLRDDILNEKILSAIVEFKTRIENVPAVLRRDRRSLEDAGYGCGCRRFHALRCKTETAPRCVLARRRFSFVRGKTNLGLGRGA